MFITLHITTLHSQINGIRLPCVNASWTSRLSLLYWCGTNDCCPSWLIPGLIWLIKIIICSNILTQKDRCSPHVTRIFLILKGFISWNNPSWNNVKGNRWHVSPWDTGAGAYICSEMRRASSQQWWNICRRCCGLSTFHTAAVSLSLLMQTAALWHGSGLLHPRLNRLHWHSRDEGSV